MIFLRYSHFLRSSICMSIFRFDQKNAENIVPWEMAEKWMKHSNNNKENYNKNNYFIKKNNLFARNYEENKLFIGLSCHLLGAFHYFLSDFCNYWFLLLEFASSWNFRVSFGRRKINSVNKTFRGWSMWTFGWEKFANLNWCFWLGSLLLHSTNFGFFFWWNFWVD